MKRLTFPSRTLCTWRPYSSTRSRITSPKERNGRLSPLSALKIRKDKMRTFICKQLLEARREHLARFPIWEQKGYKRLLKIGSSQMAVVAASLAKIHDS